MTRKSYFERQQSFYLFLMISAYLSTIGFGIYYHYAGIPQIYQPTFGAFLLFVVLGIASFSAKNLVWLFRASISIALAAFYNQIFFTGGILSPAAFELVIPPLLAFFYRPVSDRFVFMALSFFCWISFWPLTSYDFAQDLLPETFQYSHSMFCGIFVFSIVGIFTILFRSAIVHKNKKIGDSLRQLRETTEKLIQSEKMASLGLLSAGVAHEINNPLNFIKGGVELIEKRCENEQGIEDYLQVIHEGLNRATAIVNSMNHFSRQTDSMIEECDIHNILDNTINILRNRFKGQSIVVEKNYEPSSFIICGNEGKLHQAFLNILTNSEQAIEQIGGQISIKTRSLKKHLEVEITDDGCGISPENLRKIKDPFFTTKPPGQGTGLGLAITCKIFDQHQAITKIESKLNKGTKFSIRFMK